MSAPPPPPSQTGQPRIVTGQSPSRALVPPRSCSGDAICTPFAWRHDQEASSSGATKSIQAELVLAGPSIRSQAISSSLKARLPGEAKLATSYASGAPGNTDAAQSPHLSSSLSQALIGRASDQMPPQHAGMLPGLRTESTAGLGSLAMPALLSSARTEAAGSSSSLSCTEPLQAEYSRGASLLQLLEAARGRRTVPMSSKEAEMPGGLQLLPANPEQRAPARMAGASAMHPAESLRLQIEPASNAHVAARPGFAALPTTYSANAIPALTESLLSFSQPAPEGVMASMSRSVSKQMSPAMSLPLGAVAQRETPEAQHGKKRSRAMSPTWGRNVAQQSWVQSAQAAESSSFVVRSFSLCLMNTDGV